MQSTKQALSATHQSRIQSLLSEMTLAEKIGQMTQVEKNSITPQAVTEHAIGSILSGGGGNPTPNTAQAWAGMVREFAEAALKSRLAIPMIYGVDAVHGHNNVVGAVVFPHNIGLGATRDTTLLANIGEVTAREILATNVHWTFAPAVSIPQDIRWGRTYEGYSEQTALVSELSHAFIEGLSRPIIEGVTVLPSVKHFIADGGTGWNTTAPAMWLGTGNWQAATADWRIDQGNAIMDEATLREVFLPPYAQAIEQGAMNIMVSFSSWNGTKMHANRYLITEVLKEELGFQGFIVSDWMAVDQIDPDFETSVATSINAGVDMVMVPYDYKTFIKTLTNAVEKGLVSIERIDDAVRRILRVKLQMGLFDVPIVDSALLATVGSAEHRAIAREAVRKSATLLKNEGVLPLAKDSNRILVAGAGADDIGLQSGGWTIDWQGGQGAITDGTTLLAGFRQAVSPATELIYSATGEFETQAPVGIVVVAEKPYAEGLGDRADVSLSTDDIALIERVRRHCDKLIVILLSGRPLIITEQVPLMDAFIAAWLPGTEGNGIADVLFGDYPFTGKLSFSWARTHNDIPLSALKANPNGALWSFGDGLTT